MSCIGSAWLSKEAFAVTTGSAWLIETCCAAADIAGAPRRQDVEEGAHRTFSLCRPLSSDEKTSSFVSSVVQLPIERAEQMITASQSFRLQFSIAAENDLAPGALTDAALFFPQTRNHQPAVRILRVFSYIDDVRRIASVTLQGRRCHLLRFQLLGRVVTPGAVICLSGASEGWTIGDWRLEGSSSSALLGIVTEATKFQFSVKPASRGALASAVESGDADPPMSRYQQLVAAAKVQLAASELTAAAVATLSPKGDKMVPPVGGSCNLTGNQIHFPFQSPFLVEPQDRGALCTAGWITAAAQPPFVASQLANNNAVEVGKCRQGTSPMIVLLIGSATTENKFALVSDILRAASQEVTRLMSKKSWPAPPIPLVTCTSVASLKQAASVSRATSFAIFLLLTDEEESDDLVSNCLLLRLAKAVLPPQRTCFVVIEGRDNGGPLAAATAPGAIVALADVVVSCVEPTDAGTASIARSRHVLRLPGDNPQAASNDQRGRHRRAAAVAGIDEIESELRRAILFPLLHPQVAAKFKIAAAKGVLLYGPPGCGKTSLVRELCAEAGRLQGGPPLAFLYIDSASLLSAYVGESEAQLREAFARARRLAPCVIFFDELEAIAAARRSDSRDAPATRLLSTLLTEMDGVGTSEGNGALFGNGGGVTFVGATNLPSLLDPAVLRPGRLDRHIEVPLPDYAARVAILRSLLEDTGQNQTSGGVGVEERAGEAVPDIERIATATGGFSGASLKGAVRIACATGEVSTESVLVATKQLCR